MAIIINDNYSLQACKPFDARYLNVCSPWTSVSAVNIAIPTYRYTGLTVNIMGSEYWYKDGIADACLVPKILGGVGKLTGATNGIHLVNSGTSVSLGGTLIEGTYIDGNQEIIFGGTTPLSSFGVIATSDFALTVTPNKATIALDDTGRAALIGGKHAEISLSANTAYVQVSASTASILGTVRLLTTPSAGATSDTVLVWNSGDKQVKCLSVSTITGATAISANNGLTKAGNIISLGGTLTGTTHVNTSTYELTLGSVGRGQLKLGQIGVAGAVYSGGSTYDGIVYSGVTNAWIMQTPTALVTKEFVDIQIVNAISGITGTITGGTNGLGRTGMNICLGGTLNNTTIINANTNTLCVNNGYLSTQSGYQISGVTILRADPNDIDSIYIGDNANFNIQGTDNIGIGSWTLKSTTTGSCNLAIGASALSAITTSSGNVAIGYQAGMHETGSNKLIIANNANTCLISGDFSASGLTFNANICIGKTPITGVSTDGFLVWNSADKCVKQVDVGSIIASSITGATNGLTKVGQCVVLGGNLTSGTTITLCDNTLRLRSDSTNAYGVVDFNLNSTYANSKFGICSRDTINGIWGLSGNSQSISAYHCSDASNGSCFVVNNTGLTISNKVSSATKSVAFGANSFSYGGNYCSSNTNNPRWIPDKEYVDKQISGCSNMLKIRIQGGSPSFVMTTNDDVVGVSGLSTNQLCLPASPVLVCGRGQRLTVVDICGNALADPITINGNGTLINNGTCSTINTDYGSVTFVYNGFFWSAIAFVN